MVSKVLRYTFQFARRFLKKEDMTGIDIGKEAASIAAFVLDESDETTTSCTKCDQPFGTDFADIKVCVGACERPKFVFHKRCVPERFREEINFICEVCDPSRRDERCYACGKLEPHDILLQETCKHALDTGCDRFVHSQCLQKIGMDEFDCGVCTINVV